MSTLSQTSPWTIAWRQLTYTVTTFEGLLPRPKTLLSSLNGFCTRGTVTAFLGPSGAGKTTLLHCLSGRTSTLNGHLENSSQILLDLPSTTTASSSFFIGQHLTECTLSRLTVGQILAYAYAFKNASLRYTTAERDTHIQRTMEELLLEPTLLETVFADCSGGEQKRLSIAQELLSTQKAPNFLYLDEPTTGLDSSAAVQVMSALHRLARRQGITILVALHVPNREILPLIDQLYVLALGGICLFAGSPQKLEEKLKMENLDSCSQLEAIAGLPPIEQMIEIASQGRSFSVCVRFKELTDQQMKESFTSNVQTLEHLRCVEGAHQRSIAFTWRHLLLQTGRQCRVFFLTNTSSFVPLTGTLIVFLLILSSLSTDSAMSTSSGCYPKESNSSSSNITCATFLLDDTRIRENVIYQMYLIMFTGFSVSAGAALWFIYMLNVVRHEAGNGWYSPSTFFWASQLVGLLEVTLFSVLTASLAFFLSGNYRIDTEGLNLSRLTLYSLIFLSYTIYMQSFGQLLGTLLLGLPEYAIIVCLILNRALSIINGIFIDVERSSSWAIRQASHGLAVKYPSYGLLYSLFQFQRCHLQTEMSKIVEIYNLEAYTLEDYLLRPLFIAVLLRLATFLLLMFRFSTVPEIISSFGSHLHIVRKRSVPSQDALSQALPKESTFSIEEASESEVNEMGEDNDERVKLNGRVALAWRNLTLYQAVPLVEMPSKPSKETPILRSINGQLSFGTLTGLMGPSGAGKTSLLKVLTGQCKARLDPASTFYLSRFAPFQTCFVAQDVAEHLLAGLTATQLLLYASKLKNASLEAGPRPVKHQHQVAQLLRRFGLTQTANTAVNQCSGGERKRLALAAELTSSQPATLVAIDEPTSGLDSTSASLVLHTLQSLARRQGIAVLVSLHQPTVSHLPLFDQLYVLARGGVTIFADSPLKIQQNLEQVGVSIAGDAFPVEVLIQEACSNWNSPLVQKLEQITTNKICSLNARLPAETALSPDGVPLNRVRFTLSSLTILFQRTCTHFRVHTWPLWLVFLALYTQYIISLQVTYSPRIFTATGCLSLSEDETSCHASLHSPVQREAHRLLLENLKYNYFFSVLFIAYATVQYALLFNWDYPTLRADTRNGWYHFAAYYLIKSTFDLLLTLPILLLYVLLGNWIDTVRPGGAAYPQLVTIFLLGTASAQGIGQAVGLFSRGHLPSLALIAVLISIACTMLSNMAVSYGRLHYVYQALSVLVPTRFMFEAVMLLQYGFGLCRVDQAQVLLLFMNLTDADYYTRLILLLANLLFYRILVLYLLYRRLGDVSRKNRRRRVLFVEKKQIVSSKSQLECA